MKNDRALNDLVAQWAGKDLQPWLATAGKDYPELRSYQLGSTIPLQDRPRGLGGGGGAGSFGRVPITTIRNTGIATQPTATTPALPTGEAGVDYTSAPLKETLEQMKGKYGAYQTWLGEVARPDVEGAAGRAGADVTAQSEIARQSEARRMMGLGIDPTSGRFGALSRRGALDEARTKASAMTRARRGEVARATGLRMAGEEQLTGMLGQQAGVAGEISGLREAGVGREWMSRESELARQGAYGEAARTRAWEGKQSGLRREFESLESQKQRAWQSGETDKAQEFQNRQEELQREFLSGESEKRRTWETGERAGSQEWQAGQAETGREWETGQRRLDRQQEEARRQRERQWQTGEREAGQGWQERFWELQQGPEIFAPSALGYARKEGGLVVPNIYKVGEGGTKKKPRPELYISDRGGVEEVGKKGPETISVRESGLIIPNPKTMKEMGKRKKGSGYFGELKRSDGMISTELSIGVNIDDKEIEIPSLVPTLTKKEINHLLGGSKPTKQIINKAVQYAKKRIAAGKSPFAQTGEAISKKQRTAGIETRQRGGRVRGNQFLGQLISDVEGEYAARIADMLRGIGRTKSMKGVAWRAGSIDPYKRVKALMKRRDIEIATLRKSWPGRLGQGAEYRGYREGGFEPGVSTRKAMAEREIGQRREGFDPNYPGTDRYSGIYMQGPGGALTPRPHGRR